MTDTFDEKRIYHSADELYKFLSNLNESDYAEIKVFTRFLAKKYKQEQSDIFNETVVRLLKKTRNCPKDVEIMDCVKNIMRSVASNEYQNKLRHRDYNLPFDENVLNIANLPEEVIDDKRIELLKELCEENPNAFFVLDEQIAGSKPEEIQKKLGIDSTQYSSALRFIRRKINVLMGVNHGNK